MAKCCKQDVLSYIERLKNIKYLSKEKALVFLERFISSGDDSKETDEYWVSQIEEERRDAESETLKGLKAGIEQLLTVCNDKNCAIGLHLTAGIITDALAASNGVNISWETEKEKYIEALKNIPPDKSSEILEKKKYKKLKKAYDKLNKKYKKLKDQSKIA